MAKGSFEAYRKALSDVYRGWWFAWPLTERVRVGDVRALYRGGSVTAGTLAGHGMEAKAGPAGAPGDITYDAGGTVAVRFKAAGVAAQGFTSVPLTEAGALVEFRDERSALIVYTGLEQSGFQDLAQLAGALVARVWSGGWDPALLVVSDVVSARAGTVLIAEHAGASAELRIEGAVGPEPLRLVDLAGRAGFSASSRLGLNWTGTDLTPCYRVVRVRRTWLNRVKEEYGTPQPGRGLAPGPAPPVLLEEARDEAAAVIEHVEQTARGEHEEREERGVRGVREERGEHEEREERGDKVEPGGPA
ncbi:MULTISPECIES: hypothetical protein [unclassified Streptomyces]|uniref:hypothetical protein n=1 Tax=unclassified Streptomyces TaxID=2593676 RepID=UPI00278C1845|nr:MULTISPECIES: hypothetical protein [unclassified Streptomyces]